MESLDRSRTGEALVGSHWFYLSGCQDGFSCGWNIAYLHHFADKDGNRIAPITMGLPPDMPEEVRNLVAFKVGGGNKTELTVTEYDWPVGQMMEMSRKGMEQCLDKMAASVVET